MKMEVSDVVGAREERLHFHVFAREERLRQRQIDHVEQVGSQIVDSSVNDTNVYARTSQESRRPCRGSADRAQIPLSGEPGSERRIVLTCYTLVSDIGQRPGLIHGRIGVGIDRRNAWRCGKRVGTGLIETAHRGDSDSRVCEDHLATDGIHSQRKISRDAVTLEADEIIACRRIGSIACG